MTKRCYVACDLGAESGRVILGTLGEGRVVLDEVHRFPTGAVRIQDSLRWNIVSFFEELKKGLRKIADRDVVVSSLSVDSWGVDYVLLNQLAADATGRTVLAGPVEATAIGNVLIQAIGMGDVESLSQLRQLVSDSFTITSFQPVASPAMEEARQEFAVFAK